MANDGEATIVVDGDTAGFVRSGERIGESLKKAAKEGGGALNEQLLHINTHFTKAMARATALVHILGAAAEASNKIAGEQVEGNRAAGSALVKGYSTFQRLGSHDPGTEYQAMARLAGGTTLEQRQSDMEALASFNDGRRAKINGHDRGAYMRAAASGVYSSDELLELLKHHRQLPGAQEISARISNLPPGVAQQLALTNRERENEVATHDANLRNDPVLERMAASDLARWRAENPGKAMSQETIKKTLSFGGGDAMVDAGERNRRKGQYEGIEFPYADPNARHISNDFRPGGGKVFDQIEENTRTLNTPKLRLVEGE